MDYLGPVSCILGLLMLGGSCAAAAGPNEAALRLAVGSRFSCLACEDGPICESGAPTASQSRLPGAERLPWRKLTRLAAGSRRVCALLGRELYCWDYSDEKNRFGGPEEISGIADFAAANHVLCIVSIAGNLTCTGSARVHADPRGRLVEPTPAERAAGAETMIVGPEITLYSTERVVDVSYRVMTADVRRVAASYWGACYSTHRGGVYCGNWGGDRFHEVIAPRSTKILSLRGAGDGIEIKTTSGYREVSFYPRSFTAPPLLRTIGPPDLDPTWVYGHGTACRVGQDREIQCRDTGVLDRGEPWFHGWLQQPRCLQP